MSFFEFTLCNLHVNSVLIKFSKTHLDLDSKFLKNIYDIYTPNIIVVRPGQRVPELYASSTFLFICTFLFPLTKHRHQQACVHKAFPNQDQDQAPVKKPSIII